MRVVVPLPKQPLSVELVSKLPLDTLKAKSPVSKPEVCSDGGKTTEQQAARPHALPPTLATNLKLFDISSKLDFNKRLAYVSIGFLLKLTWKILESYF